MMNNRKRAIVMGATSGIGKEVALLLAKKGWQVGIAGRREDRLTDVMHNSENIILKKRIDITTRNANELLTDMVQELGGVDLYLHCSGIGWQNSALEITKEIQTVETNSTGFTRMVTTAFNWMAEHNGGHIACITSIAGTKGLGAAPAYSSTKRYQCHYLECLTQLARIRKLNIKITDIQPGFVDTDLIANANYPLKLPVRQTAEKIIKAIERKKNVTVIDWRYNILVKLWRLIPRCIWVRMTIK